MFTDFKNILDRQKLQKEPKELRTICENLFAKGKNLRSKLVALVSSPLGLPDEKVKVLCRLIEYIHSSSLLHDDFIDQSKTRRGMETAWLEFSPQQAVLAGDYLLAQVNLYLVEEQNLGLLKITAESIAALAKGEFVQRELQVGFQQSLSKLAQVSELKTGSLFKWCLKAPFIFQDRGNQDFYNLLDSIGYHFGVIYQRSDDLLDFGINNQHSKSILVDLEQGYCNSFSCYLVQGASSSLIKQYQSCKTLDEIKVIFPNFEKALKKFHEDNKILIKKTEQEIDKLISFLNNKEQVILPELKKFVSLFYWRTKT